MAIRKKKVEAPVDRTVVTIREPNMQKASFKIVGTKPYVQCRFSEKSINQIMATQQAGSVAKGKKAKAPRDFDADYKAAMHISEEGWAGIPITGMRRALIAACKLVDFEMTMAKKTIFVEADGLDALDGIGLIRLYGDPEKHIAYTRNATGVVDLRSRPMWKKWHANVTITYDADRFNLTDVTNLLQRAGLQVGVGEGRPDSKNSPGMGWGTFAIERKKS